MIDEKSKERSEQIIVTICCTAFNQEAYIRKCLDGIVMQITNFKYEAIVHDDASTDETAAIIQEYAAKYPDIIKAILETENQYSKHNGSLRKIMRANTKGKYVATCEADDYWTDPYKLQKQVDIMESDSNISMVYTAYKTVDSEGQLLLRPVYETYKRISFSGDILSQLICSGNFVMTLTTCIRKDVYESNLLKRSNIGIDYLLFLTAASMGSCVYLPEETGCYRYSPKSEMNANLDYVKYSYIKAKKYFVKTILQDGIKQYSVTKKIKLYVAFLENAILFYVKSIDKEYLSIVLSKRKTLLFLPIAIISLCVRKLMLIVGVNH